MTFLYDLGIRLFVFGIRLAAVFNSKARLWVEGRRNWRERYVRPGPPEGGRSASLSAALPASSDKNAAPSPPRDGLLWVHAASLGEFEQGRPVIETFREQFPGWRVVLTFFSPSGYEIRKNYPYTDLVCYLPADTRRNAADFLNLIKPDAAIFVKYDFWANYLSELKKRGTPTLLISALFRESQPFFKWYGGLWRNMLGCFTHIFVQNEHSAKLLQNIGFQNISIAGDTRVDRVLKIAESAVGNEIVAAFAPPGPPGGGEAGAAPDISGNPTLTPTKKQESISPGDKAYNALPPSGGTGGALIAGTSENTALTPTKKQESISPGDKAYNALPPSGGQGGALIAGSTWEADEKIILTVLQKPEFQEIKLIVAPHDPARAGQVLQSARDAFPDQQTPAVLYSRATPETARAARTLIIDNVGMLNTLYRYAAVAYIGGGFGKGIHNTLEPAAWGLPVIFGPNYTKFEEARCFVAAGGAFPVQRPEELAAALEKLRDPDFYQKASRAVLTYLEKSKGATEKVMAFLKEGI